MMTDGIETTLEQLLDAREQRAVKQKKLIGRFMLPLVSFTVNIPGACKKTPASSSIFREGCSALMKKLDETGSSLVYSESYEPDTGHEAYFVVNTDAQMLKAYTLQLENQHPLGRLFDFDVIERDGNAVSREDLGYTKRKCLLCEQAAHICGRSGRHRTEELIKEIQSIVDAYFRIIP
ncbi:MAG: holo-ACP synthase CitX [Clostridiales bacterium GWB2_37_7]|nr:MAG: holo-ACP synthase CitX [Clostridiales bacterium GWB2_37_7]